MNRFFGCFSLSLLLCYAAAAQNLTANPLANSTPSTAPAAVQPGVMSTVSPEIVQFQKIEDSWSDAVNRRDQYALELVLSPLFVDVSASGDVTTRNQQVVQVISADDKTVSLTQKVVTVRMLGDIAVANGTYTLHHKMNGTPVDEKGVFTHVFERVRNGWLCINSQRTVLRQDMTTKKSKATTASEPFHIPLFSKGDKGPQ
ncbi:MAG: nuclear transport factor 2 family protein [Terracidiphilus sp.]|jgi:ketosteroid isomerase-like protein